MCSSDLGQIEGGHLRIVKLKSLLNTVVKFLESVGKFNIYVPKNIFILMLKQNSESIDAHLDMIEWRQYTNLNQK